MLELVFSDDFRTVCIYQGLPQMGPERREAWQTWMDRHGLDPNKIPLGTSIICDDVNRRVYFTTYDPKLSQWRNEIVRVESYVQLEAPAMPFPR